MDPNPSSVYYEIIYTSVSLLNFPINITATFFALKPIFLQRAASTGFSSRYEFFPLYFIFQEKIFLNPQHLSKLCSMRAEPYQTVISDPHRSSTDKFYDAN